ncbi:hypothetical protein [Skermania piniformis]|uniref:Uncharacterized protein n=1 Tax=Skermania pinensis TaxID=39122 RepID=A0ABX8SDI5_9ACTN|nr:hypothetical protein [Skermania piniformis]QXQ15491.1 hypothetical protein KV203_09450 [Skermania piniformis]
MSDQATARTGYVVLDPPVPVRTDGPPVVVEFFWYASAASLAWQQEFRKWLAAAGPVQYRRVPVNLDPRPTSLLSYGPHQRLYYSLEVLGLLDLLHERALNELQTAKLATDASTVDWAVYQGVDRGSLRAVMGSIEVSAKCNAATQMTEQYQIDAPAQIAVGGRYVTGPAMLGGAARVAPVLDALLTLVKQQRD